MPKNFRDKIAEILTPHKSIRILDASHDCVVLDIVGGLLTISKSIVLYEPHYLCRKAWKPTEYLDGLQDWERSLREVVKVMADYSEEKGES